VPRPFYRASFGSGDPHFTSPQRNFASLLEASDDNENLRASERAGRKKKYLIL